MIRLLWAVLFNALIGNHDARAKNFSLLYTGSTPALTTLYDLLCMSAYPTLTTKMAMKLGSTYRFSEVQLRHRNRFAEAAALSQAQTRKRVVRVEKLLPSAARCPTC